jgi:murein DD-endopeptidase MepM/ murein hydrolase activator NlpD
MIRLLAAALAVALLAPTAAAGELRLAGPLVQGGMVRGQAPPGSEVRLDGRELRLSKDGRFVFGFGRDHAPEAKLEVRYPNGTHEHRRLAVERRRYDIQRIDGLPPNMVTPSAEELARIRREGALITAVRQRDTPETWFAQTFAWPAKGRVSGVYGSQRILNGEPRRPHFGLDIAAPPGTPVVAPARGTVALAEADLYFTGGTVMLDHGHGITSVFSHLSRLAVAVGDEVVQGQQIGAIGATGRATGPHLDWRVNWFGERLDPALLLGPMPGEE